ncbi:MAG: hypothetical protein ACHQQ3_08435 [Gemmatimonadales bacterium]
MSPVRQGVPGTTRTCPHCRQTILESASICPACRHHLRFEPGVPERAPASFSPLRVEGTIEHPDVGEPWEYSVLLSIRNGSGVELTRHVASVGVMHPTDRRSFTIAVEVFKPRSQRTRPDQSA